MLTGNGGFGNKPRALKCHICGREYGTASLQIHLKTCQNTNRYSVGLEGGRESYGYRDERPNSNASGRGVPLKNPGTQAPSKSQYQDYSNRNDNTSYTILKSTQTKQQGISKQTGGARNQNYGGRGYGPMEGEYQNIQLVGCNLCKRKFAADRIERHRQACTRSQKGEAKHAKKVALAERKQKETERFVAKQAKYKKSNWRQQHKEFVENLRYNRRLKAIENRGGDIRSIGPPPKMTAVQTDLVVCPYCYRKFNPQSAEKHINICKNVINKPKPVPSKPSQTSMRTSHQSGFGVSSSKTLPSNASINKSGGAVSYGNYVDNDYQRPSYSSTPGKSQAKQVAYTDVRNQLARSIQKGGGFSTQYNPQGSKGSLTQYNSSGQTMNNNRGGLAVTNSNYASLAAAKKTTTQDFNNLNNYNSSNSRTGKTGNRFY